MVHPQTQVLHDFADENTIYLELRTSPKVCCVYACQRGWGVGLRGGGRGLMLAGCPWQCGVPDWGLFGLGADQRCGLNIPALPGG